MYPFNLKAVKGGGEVMITALVEEVAHVNRRM